jgi:hypothetical protein
VSLCYYSILHTAYHCTFTPLHFSLLHHCTFTLCTLHHFAPLHFYFTPLHLHL